MAKLKPLTEDEQRIYEYLNVSLDFTVKQLKQARSDQLYSTCVILDVQAQTIQSIMDALLQGAHRKHFKEWP